MPPEGAEAARDTLVVGLVVVTVEEGDRHPDRRWHEEHFPLVGDRSRVVHDHEIDPECRGREPRRDRRVDDRARDVAASDLRAPAVLDDGCPRHSHQPRVVLGIRCLPGRRKDTHPTEVSRSNHVGRPPCRDDGWHEAEHRDAGVTHEIDESPRRRGIGVQRHRRAVDEGCIDEPRSHHPAEVGRPGDHVAGVDVVVVAPVHCRFDRRCLIPRNGLGFPRGPRREEDVRVITGGANNGGPRSGPRQEVRPGEVVGATGDPCPRFDDDARHIRGLRALVVHGECPAETVRDVLGDDGDRLGDRAPERDLLGGERVCDRDDDASGGDGPEVRDDGLDGHRHRDGDALARPVSGLAEAVGETGDLGSEFGDGDAPYRRSVSGDDRGGVVWSTQTGLHDRVPGARQPIGHGQVARAAHRRRGVDEHDAELIDDDRPESVDVLDRPAVELCI